MLNTSNASYLRSGLLLLAQEESVKRHTGDLNNLKAAAWDISLGLTSLSEPRNQHLVVLVDVVKATIAGNEARDLLSILDQLHSDTLTDGGVGLLGLQAAVRNIV